MSYISGLCNITLHNPLWSTDYQNIANRSDINICIGLILKNVLVQVAVIMCPIHKNRSVQSNSMLFALSDFMLNYLF